MNITPFLITLGRLVSLNLFPNSAIIFATKFYLCLIVIPKISINILNINRYKSRFYKFLQRLFSFPINILSNTFY